MASGGPPARRHYWPTLPKGSPRGAQRGADDVLEIGACFLRRTVPAGIGLVAVGGVGRRTRSNVATRIIGIYATLTARAITRFFGKVVAKSHSAQSGSRLRLLTPCGCCPDLGKWSADSFWKGWRAWRLGCANRQILTSRKRRPTWHRGRHRQGAKMTGGESTLTRFPDVYPRRGLPSPGCKAKSSIKGLRARFVSLRLRTYAFLI
jgi:hypothetical protein